MLSRFLLKRENNVNLHKLMIKVPVKVALKFSKYSNRLVIIHGFGLVERGRSNEAGKD